MKLFSINKCPFKQLHLKFYVINWPVADLKGTVALSSAISEISKDGIYTKENIL